MNSRCQCRSFRNFLKVRKIGIGIVLAAVCAYSILFSVSLRAQVNESMLPSWAQQTWNPGVPGGIPADNDTTRPATVWVPSGNPYNGYSVDPSLTGTANAAAFTSAMQNAINSAGAAATTSLRQIVYLAPGEYFVNPQTDPDGSGAQVGLYVRYDDVTIRGSGSAQTTIVCGSNFQNLTNGYGTCILMGHRYGSSDSNFAVENVTADALQGSTTVQVADASPYVVGDVITIDHQDGSAALDPGGMADLNGGFLFLYDGSYFKRQPSGSFNDGPDTGAQAFGSVSDIASANTNAANVVPTGWRTVQQEDVITAISSNTLTLKDPLNIDFPLSSSPQVWRTVPLNTSSVPVGNRWDGIENIQVRGGSDMWEFPGGVIGLSFEAYGWVENVDADGEQSSSDTTDYPGKYGDNIGLGHCYECTVTGSYSHGSINESPDNTGHNGAYGIDITGGSSQCLIDNNVSIANDKPIVMRNSGGGNVIAYNYVDEVEDWNAPGWQESGIDSSHGAFDHSNLFEGNWAANLGNDGTHGNEGDNVWLRNYANGVDSFSNNGAMTSNLATVRAYCYDYHNAYAGNVLEQTASGAVYQESPTLGNANGEPAIYTLGYCGGNIGWDDGYSANEIWINGNWDNINNSQQWPNGSVTIPPSFYLTSAPAYFSGYTWPWVDPSTGTTYTLPAKARYDSGNPVTQPGGGGGAPAAGLSPTSLSFGSQTDGTTSASQSVTVTNSGTANLTFGSGAVTISGTNAADFAISSDGCSSRTVAPNGTCSVSVTFTPSIVGSESATLNFADNASGSPQTASLSGTGASSGGGGSGIQYIQTVQSDLSSGATSFTSNSITTSSGDLLVVAVSIYNWQGVPDISSIQLDGTTNFTVDKDQAEGSQYRIVIASVANVSAGAHTITVNANGTMLNAVTYASEFSGAVAVSPEDGTGASTEGYGTTPASGTFTTTGSNDLWVAAFVGNTGLSSVTAGSGWIVPANGTALGSGTQYPPSGFEYSIANGQTSGNGSFTINSSPNWAAVAIAYKSSGSGGGGAPAVGLSPASLSFASQADGTTSASQSVTVTNSGTANLTFGSGAVTISGTNAADFAVASDGCSGQTVVPNGTCSVSVTFTPSIVGSESATLNFADNASGSPQTASLSGTGGASGGIKYIQTVQSDLSSGATSFTSNSITTSSGDLLVVAVSIYNWQGVPDISSIQLDGATNFTVDKDQADGSQYRIVIASVANVSAGAHTITVNANGNMLNAVVYASEFSGVATASPEDGTGASAEGYGTTPASGTFTTTGSNDLWVAAFVGNTGLSSVTAGSGWIVPANGTALGSGTQYPPSGFEYSIANGQTSGNGSFTINSSPNWAALTSAYKP